MPKPIRRIAEIALVALGAAYAWLLWADMHFSSASLFPFNLATWLFIVFPWFFNALTFLAGIWVLIAAIRRGGGRFWWRWVVGAMLVYGEVSLVTREIIAANQGPVFYPTTAHPYLAHFIYALAIPALWVISAPRVARVVKA